MEQARLKLKIGEHEFEAEGPSELVAEQFALFRALVAQAPAQAPPQAERGVDTLGSTEQPHAGVIPLSLDKIMRSDGRKVSLTVRDGEVSNEIMLLLLGQKMLRGNDAVTGAEIMDGLKQTGRNLVRVDYALNKMTTAGDVITIGTRRGRRYRLTNQGFIKAQALAREQVAKVG